VHHDQPHHDRLRLLAVLLRRLRVPVVRLPRRRDRARRRGALPLR
jgi:hypothetical protein